MFQGCLMKFLWERKFHGCFKSFQRSLKKTFKVFQKKFHVAWHSSQLPEQKEGLFFQQINSRRPLNNSLMAVLDTMFE